MPRKAIAAIAVAAVAVAAIAAGAALAMHQQGRDAARDAAPPSLSVSQPESPGPAGAAGLRPEQAPPAAEGPVPCTFDDAYPLVKAITDGTYDFSQDGWDDLVDNAGGISLEVDEASVMEPFVQYENRTMAAMEVFASVNDDASFVKTGDSSWEVTVSVRRAASPVSRGHTIDEVRDALKKKLKADGDAPEYRAQVTYTVEITGGRGRLVCTSPDWYL